jgi:pyruvate dehydrogenase (quinone)
VDLGLCGKIDDTLEALLPLLQQKADDNFLKAQLVRYDKVKKNLQIYVKDPGTADNIHPECVADTLDRLADDDAIFTVDTGMCCVWGARYITATGQRNLLGSFNHGSMANAMPQAIGAALACPGRQVIALSGDGGLSMLMGDLATIVQYNLPVKIIVFNNRSLGMVKLEMQVAGLPESETKMYNPDFALVAKAMGMKGITVNEPAALEEALQEAFKYNGPVLVNVFTDAHALALPPKISYGQVKGMTLAMGRSIIDGEMQEVFDTFKSNYKHIQELF